MDEFNRDGWTFDVLDSGPTDGPPVVLLHGFPQFNDSWAKVFDRLTADGYRCLAPNQRGYSPRARPRRRRDYAGRELVADVLALLDALGAPKVHLVGHDWGAAVAWATAAAAPDRLATLSALSVPHPAAFFRSATTSRQALASWYMLFFQLPRIPEWLLTRSDGRVMQWMLRDYSGQPADATTRDVAAVRDSGALTTMLHWYRAIPFDDRRLIGARTTVPTMYVWSDGDKALLEKGARATEGYVDGEYRFEIVPGASHWLADEQPDVIADLLLEWIGAHPIPDRV